MTSLRPPIREKKFKKKVSIAEKRLLRKRKRAERRVMRRVLKKKVTRPIFLLPEPSGEADEEEEQANKTPPVDFRVNTKNKCVDVRVVLHHCPPQFINLDPTATHFVLDTLKWTRKFQVSLPYPDGIEVDPKGATAKVEHDILYVSLPIAVFPEAAREKQARISASIRQGRLLRFVQARGGELVGMRTVPPKERKRKRSAEDDDHVPIVRIGPKKKFVTDKGTLSQMAEAAAEAEESRVAGRQAQMGATEAFFKEKIAAKQEARSRKATLVDKTLNRIVSQEKKRVKDKALKLGLLEERPALAAGVDARSKGGKKVSFASTPVVVKFGGEGACGGKKVKDKKNKEATVIEYRN